MRHHPTSAKTLAESLVPGQKPYSNVHGDVWALGCILAELIATVRPWHSAEDSDRDYRDYVTDRTILFDVLPVSNAAYWLILKIFSISAELRPSLAEIRKEVLALDTFFLNENEAAKYGWTDRLEEMMLQKVLRARGAIVEASGRSSDTSSSSSSCYEARKDATSSASRYSSGSSSSAFESTSGSTESSELLLVTPPIPAIDLMKIRKISSGLELPSRIAAALSY